MRVGTDGVLLGAWAGEDWPTDLPLKCLDVGTGTGLITLMLAQRFPQAAIWGIEIEKTAAEQAKRNAASSPFSRQIQILSGNFLEQSQDQYSVGEGFDLIVSNPPFFKSSLHAPDKKRTLARHEDELPLEALMSQAARLLHANGRLALITPFDRLKDLRMYAASCRMCPTKLIPIRTRPHKLPKRLLSEWRHTDMNIDLPPLEDTLIIEPEAGYYSPEYVRLTSPFYTTSLRILAGG